MFAEESNQDKALARKARIEFRDAGGKVVAEGCLGFTNSPPPPSPIRAPTDYIPPDAKANSRQPLKPAESKCVARKVRQVARRWLVRHAAGRSRHACHSQETESPRIGFAA